LAREASGSRTLIPLEDVRPHFCVPLPGEDTALLLGANAGDASAQTELALIFLEQGKPEGAIYWLELAAKQNNTEAMHWLARCHIDGQGVGKDSMLGIRWLAQAAAGGHRISQHQMNALLGQTTNSSRSAAYDR
jgi:TPR repeat protein